MYPIREKNNKNISQDNQEENFLISPIIFVIKKKKDKKDKRDKKDKKDEKDTKKMIHIILLMFPIILLLFIFLLFVKENKYQNMLPRLTPDEKVKQSYSIQDIFNSRQLYITDAKITPQYIKYIRPLNKKEEKKYQKNYPENQTIIDRKIFAKRPDQYNYKEFCKLALEEKLIDNNTIEYNNKPDISIVIPSYNKNDTLLKSVRSIQNQKFKNIEIIIVNDCSTDNSTYLFNYLLETDPRIRIFHHMKNMGCWRSRLDGIIYSKGKYVILFDAGDLYEDNYVLEDAFNIMEKYNLDSCKFLFRILRSFQKLEKSQIFFHVGKKAKIVYGYQNIYNYNRKVFSYWGNIWNRLVRANIYTKFLYNLNELMLNLHKNVWDDSWFNKIIHKISYNFTVFERVGYVYLQNGKGEGSPKERTAKEKSKMIKEYVGFLYYHYNFSPKNNKSAIIEKLRIYDKTNKRFKLKNMREHFEVLNNLLEALIKDSAVNRNDKKYLTQLLKESKDREDEIKKEKTEK